MWSLCKVTIIGCEAMAGGGPDKLVEFVICDSPAQAIENVRKYDPERSYRTIEVEYLCPVNQISDASDFSLPEWMKDKVNA